MSGAYAGDMSSQEAWDRLKENPDAVLIDVRTQAEWDYVGLPDLSALGREVVRIPWQVYPGMALNPDFTKSVAESGVTPGHTLLLLCRSGVRSHDAAVALTAAGFPLCFNVSDGFEGNHDEAGHRGTREGWKVAGLPWRQP